MRWCWPAALIVLALDRLSKAAARSFLPALENGSYPLWPGVLHLTYAENTGVAFSMLQLPPWALTALSLAVLTFAIWMLRQWMKPSSLSGVLMGALAAGGIGNCIDRMIYGHVIDFFELRFMKFAIFNVADIAITLSCIALGAMLFFQKNGAEHAKNTDIGDG